jgi:hypothetical protein
MTASLGLAIARVYVQVSETNQFREKMLRGTLTKFSIQNFSMSSQFSNCLHETWEENSFRHF